MSDQTSTTLSVRTGEAVIGLVVIGRNEGDRLRRCLESVAGRAAAVVYVDSGSTDGSVAMARGMGVTAVDLDMSRPFTAARARQAGFERLMADRPDVEYVQFVDGDCEIADGWLERAARELSRRGWVAVVCGRLREKHREASVYNRLCDIEWNRPAGETTECGGIAMMRVGAYRQAGGFDPSLAANEEPELCLRMRQRGWTILRIEVEMGSHDAAMTRFGQWWRRSARVGYANGELLEMYGPRDGEYYRREVQSVRVWAVLIPLLAVGLAWPTRGWSLLLLGLYPMQAIRVFLRHRRRLGVGDAAAYAAACVGCKFPQLAGQVRYYRSRARGTREAVVDYKAAAPRGEAARAATAADESADGTGPAVAYLINSYPAPSQSFIRRELAALEQGGMRVRRYTMRRWAGELVDPADRAERERTQCVLDAGPVSLVAATAACMVMRPVAFWSAACLAARVARRSDRGYVAHAAYLAEACVVARWAKRDGIRHVHAHFGTNSTTVAMLCHAAGGPGYSFTAHGPEEFDRAWTIALTEKVRRSRFAIAISEFGRSQFYYKCDPADWPKVRLVRCAVDDRFLPTDDAPARPIPRPPAEARVVSVGRLAPEKGQLILLEACARVVASGVPLSLEIIGDGPLRPVLEAEIGRLGLAGHVTLAGWQPGERVREALLSARALVMPSFAEGLPVVIMEALALHRPVVATYVAGIPELVQPGVCGWLVPAGSVEAMATALREVLAASPERLAEMGDRGAELVGRHHRAATEAAKLRRMFVECLSGHEAERPVAKLAQMQAP